MTALLLAAVLAGTPRSVEVTSTAGACFVALPANGRVRMYQGGAASIWLRERAERLVLGVGESWVSIYDADAKTWTDVRYVMRQETKAKSKGRARHDADQPPPACVLGEQRPEDARPPRTGACEASWTADGAHELEVPLGGECLTTVDGISRVAV